MVSRLAILGKFKRTIPTSRRGIVTLFVSTLNGFQLRHNFEIGSELKIDWSNNQGKESQNAKLGVPTTLSSQKDFRYFFFRWNKDVVFPPRFGCFCINFDHVPEKFNLHFASLVTKIGVDWHGINNSLSKTTEDGDSKQNSQPTIQAVQQTWNKADFLRNCKDENVEPPDLECLIVVLSTCQPSLHQQPEMREILYKKCRWFDEDPQPADVSSSTSSHQRNRSRTSPNNSSK